MSEKSCTIESFADKLQRRISESTGDAQKNCASISRIEAIAAEKMGVRQAMSLLIGNVCKLPHLPNERTST